MPARQWPTMLADELKRLRQRRSWTEARPVYVAVGLLVVATGLMVFVAGIIHEPATPIPVVPPVRLEMPPRTPADYKGEQTPEAAGGVAEPAIRAVPEAVAASQGRRRDEPRPWPLTGTKGQTYGWQLHPLYGDWRFHPGLDIVVGAPEKVRAIEEGKVTDIREDGRYGLTVVVTGHYTVLYGSLAASAVKNGQGVTAGDVLGVAGTAPAEPYLHLHLSVKENDRYIDPETILKKP